MQNKKSQVNQSKIRISLSDKRKQTKALTYGGDDAHWRGGAQNYDTETVRDEARKNDEKIVHKPTID
jgi:hypothetical protein